jgi:sulfate permease, SulP family
LAAAAVVLLHLENRGVSVLGSISVEMPKLAIPVVSAKQLTSLLSLGLIISVVVMVQTAATTRSFPTDPNEPPDVNRDFIGVGTGSILAGVIGAFPVNASPPRTAVVSETGGRSQIAGMAAVAIVVLLLAFGTSLLHRIPNAALGGVLLFVALRIIRLRQIITVARQSLGEFLLILVTAAGIIVLPIEQGVGLGIALSLLHGIWTTTRARVRPLERVPGTSIWWPVSPNLPGEQEAGVIVAGFPAPLSFLNAYDFRRDILAAMNASSQKVRLVVLEATGIVEIDFTAAQVLADVIRQCHAEGIDFALARLESDRAQDAIVRFGIAALLGPDRQFHSVEEAVRARAGKS